MDEVIPMDELNRRMDEVLAELFALQDKMQYIRRDLDELYTRSDRLVSVTQQLYLTARKVTQQNR